MVIWIPGFIREERAGRALAALRAMSSPVAKARCGGTIHSIPAKELVPGDIIQLEAGDDPFSQLNPVALQAEKPLQTKTSSGSQSTQNQNEATGTA